MAFKPKNKGNGGNGGGSFEPRNFPTPKAGARKARISLIVDLGTQKRKDFEDPATKELKPQKPCQQVAVFADLVNDVVDYGGSIGKAQYRLLLNKSFGGVLEGINFTTVPPKDKDGKLIEGKPWSLHPANLLTKLAKAVGKTEIIYDDNSESSLDISLLLDQPFIADVEVTEKDSGKEDKDGNPIIYKNVNFKGASKVGMRSTGDVDDDGNEIEVPDTVAALKAEPKCITFDNATKEDIKFIRANLIKIIKLAEDYAGSQMQKAIEEFEAEQKASGASNDDNGDDSGEDNSGDTPAEDKKADKPKATGKKPAAKKEKASVEVDPDEDVPF